MNDYFESHVHSYPPERLLELVPEIRRLCSSPKTLLDIGCGVGNTMVEMGSQLDIVSPVGVESSKTLRDAAAEKTGHRVIHASVLDKDFVEVIEQKYDVVMLSSVLHHLVAKTRRGSLRNVRIALENARSLVADGGVLMIHEPVMRPRLTLGLLFYVKLLVGFASRGRRVPLSSYWANIGAPVVSYLTPGELAGMVGESDYFDLKEQWMPRIARFAGLFSRSDAAILVKVDRSKRS